MVQVSEYKGRGGIKVYRSAASRKRAVTRMLRNPNNPWNYFVGFRNTPVADGGQAGLSYAVADWATERGFAHRKDC